MMEMTFVNPAALGRPVGFNHGVLASGGRVLFLAGQNGAPAKSRDFGAQFETALSRIVAVVREAGGEPRHIAKLNIYVTRRAEYARARKRMGEIWRRLMGKHYPAMAMFEVKSLWEKEAKVELEGFAVVP